MAVLPSLKSDEFQCGMCGGIFKKGPEKEAEDELKKNFGDISKEDYAQVCDDCYKAIRNQ